MQCYSGLALALATFLSSAILAHTYIHIYVYIYIYLGVLVDYETRCAVCGGSRWSPPWSPPRFAYGVLSSIYDATVGIHKIACVNHREVP